MKLYYSTGSCSLAPHIILNEIGAAFEIERVRDRKTMDGVDFLTINQKGYVPALQLDTGEILTEGVVIQQYLADLRPETNLLPPQGAIERVRVQEMLVYISTELHKSHAPLFNPHMPGEARHIFEAAVRKHYAFLETQLEDGRPYLMGEHPTIADIYLFVISRWGKSAGYDINAFPNVAALAGRIAARPATQTALNTEALAKATS
ncbi:MAG: glutathione transferase GstA [Hyphomonadaceae bacterium]